MKPASFGHGGERWALAANVAEHLEDHETQEEEVQASTDPRHNDEGHLNVTQLRKR